VLKAIIATNSGRTRYHVLADDPDSRSWLPGKQVERVTHRDFDIELLAKLGSSPTIYDPRPS